MAGTSSIGGLASGLDTAGIINQLMTLEAMSQSKLKTQVATEQGKVSALQKLNTSLQSLVTAAGDLGTKGTVWSTLRTTSSNPGVTVTATTSATPGGFDVTVTQTALTHRLSFTDAHAKGDQVTGTGTSVLLKRAGEPDLQVDTANGTLQELATAINAADAGVRATLVRTGTSGGVDQYRLMVESTTSGADQAFELTDLGGSPLLGGATVRAGQDAVVEVGGITATSRTNTFTDVVPGVTITLAAGATGAADVTLARDAEGTSGAVKSFVEQVNSLLTQMQSLTLNSKDGAGVLKGDATIRRVASALQNAVFPNDGTSMAAFGLQTDRYGKLVFDEAKFAEAYAADPAAVAAAFTGAGGFASRVEQVAKTASDKYDGAISNAINSHSSTITRLNKSIEAWDARLELRRQTLERQYTALETVLSQLGSQSAWLTSQLDALSASTQ
ncbi:flagellar filament capping protein FliD [Nocardioides sp. J54]|uniref:flagellar filament capping protein FliD n=1 Tax=Nocardioides sp. J54 TaxID=935866 RepID=UPI00048F060F|nr:flagellar filament capping protein FliD [Nocardioides sp. J54]